eukprot:4516395-Prymnesium_polylepis.1
MRVIRGLMKVTWDLCELTRLRAQAAARTGLHDAFCGCGGCGERAGERCSHLSLFGSRDWLGDHVTGWVTHMTGWVTT